MFLISKNKSFICKIWKALSLLGKSAYLSSSWEMTTTDCCENYIFKNSYSAQEELFNDI